MNTQKLFQLIIALLTVTSLSGCSTSYLVYESEADHDFHAEAVHTQMELVADGGGYGIIAAKDENKSGEEDYYLSSQSELSDSTPLHLSTKSVILQSQNAR